MEGTTWQPATENSLFSGDTLVFPGPEPVKLAGEDPGDWHEVVILGFDGTEYYEKLAVKLPRQENIARYHLLNLMEHAEDPKDPTKGNNVEASAESQYEQYSDKATRLLG